MKKSIEESLIEAMTLVTQEGGMPNHIMMHTDAFIELGVSLGFTREYMEEYIRLMDEEVDEV